MGLDDYRRWLDVAARDGRAGYVALEVTGDSKLRMTVSDDDPTDAVEVVLDYSDAGMLLDWLREGLSVMLARRGNVQAAVALIGATLSRDTPQNSDAGAASDPSGMV